MKILKLAGVLLIMLSVSACVSNNPGQNSDSDYSQEEMSSVVQSQAIEESTKAEHKAVAEKIYARIDNHTPIDQLVTTEYSLDSLQKFARNGTPFAGYAFSIRDIDEAFPIECIRKVSDHFYYVVYKVKEGGYLFVHLISPYEKGWTGEDNGLEHSHSYYRKESTKVSKVKQGDSFDMIAASDPNIVGNNFNFLHEIVDGEPCYHSIHIESGKLYDITYRAAKTTDELKKSTVKSIKISPDLIIEPEGFAQYHYQYNYNILDIDQSIVN